MIVLPASEAYRRWASSYDHENVVTTLECALVERLSPSARGLRLLDVGCGTGRRLVDTGASLVLGVEPCEEMLREGRRRRRFGPEVELVEGDVRALPVTDGSFDLIWARLMIGHVAQLDTAYRELARAAAPGGKVVVTDFHAEASRAGMKRSFRDGGEHIEIEHHVHDAVAQVAAASREGLALLHSDEARIGPPVRHFYEAAGLTERYERDCGTPIVSALVFVRSD